MSCTSSSRRWVRILRQTSASDPFLCSKLLWRIRQRRGHDVRRRDPNVFFPDSQAKWEKSKIFISWNEWHTPYNPATKKCKNLNLLITNNSPLFLSFFFVFLFVKSELIEKLNIQKTEKFSLCFIIWLFIFEIACDIIFFILMLLLKRTSFSK